LVLAGKKIMKRMAGLLLASAALFALGVGQAAAADAVVVEEPVIVADVFSWTGFYVGLNAGYGWGDADHQPGNGGTGINDFDIDGGFAGGQVGYNWQIDRFVIGAEADIQWSGIEGDCDPGECGVPQSTSHEIDWFGTVRARLGYAAGEWMPYITGGYAFGDATRTTGAGGGAEADNGIDGWVAGAGVEWAFAPNWSAKAEYQYLDFGDETYDFPAGIDPVVDLTVHTVRIGVNYRFN
jgi:outer membrane immunogenic protein